MQTMHKLTLAYLPEAVSKKVEAFFFPPYTDP